MSVTPNGIVAFGSTDMPEADSTTVGGAVNFASRIGFCDVNATIGAGTGGHLPMQVDYVSSSTADTATKAQVTGRDSTGTIQTPTAVTLNGTTPVTSSTQTFGRLGAGVITGGAISSLSNPGGTAAVGDVGVIGNTRFVSGAAAQTGSANTSGTTPPLFKLVSGGGLQLTNYAVYAGLGMIIRMTSGLAINELRMISARYAASAYGTDVVAINRDWTTTALTTSTTAAGNATLHFSAGVPTSVYPGIAVTDTTSAVIPSATTVITVTSNTVVMSANATGGGVGSGDTIQFGAIPASADTYDLAFGFLFDVIPAGVPSQTPVTAITRIFWTAQADVPGGSQRVYYEKAFVDNTNTTIALTNANIQILSESPSLPSGAVLDLALNDVLNDTGTSANRQTLPANADTTALVFVTQPSPVNVIASPGSLPSGAAPNTAGSQGVWYRLTLPAGTTVYNGTGLTETNGATV